MEIFQPLSWSKRLKPHVVTGNFKGGNENRTCSSGFNWIVIDTIFSSLRVGYSITHRNISISKIPKNSIPLGSSDETLEVTLTLEHNVRTATAPSESELRSEHAPEKKKHRCTIREKVGREDVCCLRLLNILNRLETSQLGATRHRLKNADILFPFWI